MADLCRVNGDASLRHDESGAEVVRMFLLPRWAGARVTRRSPPGEMVLVCGASSWWDLHGTPTQAPVKDPGHARGITLEGQVSAPLLKKTRQQICFCKLAMPTPHF